MDLECRICGKIGPLLEFEKTNKTKIGRLKRCKVCCNAAQRKYLKDNPGPRAKALALTEQWQRDNPEKQLLIQIRHRAKRNKIPFSLTIEDIVIPTYCPLLGIELQRGVGTGGHCDSSPSLDRIDPKLGYERGNVWVISNRANRIKNDATVKELRMIADGLERRQSPSDDYHFCAPR
jgi:hypothetical protein